MQASSIRRNGFSLIELMIALALMGIALGGGVPAFRGLLERQRGSALLMSLQQDIALARSQAALSQRRVSLCPSADQVHCGSDWNQGRLVFADDNGNGSREDGETILRHDDAPVGLAMNWRSALRKPYLQFLPSGMTNHVNGSFVLCNEAKDRRSARALIINKMGRARASRDRSGDGIHEDASGRPLTCP
ncbi:MAG: GspH/FimT family pseudopilin [Gammaproteobacteria bacterium]|nr:GspH/FimT family pseudopilin [Gammaproteobacteria bacterium]